jgi:hypothetical protein
MEILLLRISRYSYDHNLEGMLPISTGFELFRWNPE